MERWALSLISNSALLLILLLAYLAASTPAPARDWSCPAGATHATCLDTNYH